MANPDKLDYAFEDKLKKYQQFGTIIPVVIRYNGVIYQRSIDMLLDVTKDQKTWNSLYTHIYNSISKNWIYAEKSCRQKAAALMEDNALIKDLM